MKATYVRQLTLDDRYEAAAVSKKAVDIMPYATEPIPIEHVLKLTEHFLGASSTAKFFGAFDKETDKLIGVIGAYPTVQPFLAKMYLQEVYWFVEEEYRSTSTAGIRLLMELEKWAEKEPMCEGLVISTFVSFDVSAIYERRGYTLMEKTYLRQNNKE